MNDQPTYLPRPGDLSPKQIKELAERAILDMGGPSQCEVHFKFTCQWCGTRCTFIEPNVIFESGECLKCQKTTLITLVGFSVHIKIGR